MSGRDESVEDRQQRLARNEAVFREVNNRIEGLNNTFTVSADYRRIRHDPALFVLVRGHEDLAVGAVVEDDRAYIVVRKHPGCGQVGSDP